MEASTQCTVCITKWANSFAQRDSGATLGPVEWLVLYYLFIYFSILLIFTHIFTELAISITYYSLSQSLIIHRAHFFIEYFFPSCRHTGHFLRVGFGLINRVENNSEVMNHGNDSAVSLQDEETTHCTPDTKQRTKNSAICSLCQHHEQELKTASHRSEVNGISDTILQGLSGCITEFSPQQPAMSHLQPGLRDSSALISASSQLAQGLFWQLELGSPTGTQSLPAHQKAAQRAEQSLCR